MPRILRAIYAMTAALALGACSTTLVQSLPIGKSTACDAAWPGRWKTVEHDPSKPDQNATLDISADCTQFTFTDPEKTETEQHTVTLVSSRAGDFIRFASPGDEPDCFGGGSTHCGIALIRYEREGNEIRLFNPDHRKVHDALASRRVSGYTEANDDPTVPGTVGGNMTDAPPPPSDSAFANAIATQRQDAGHRPIYHNLIAGNPEQITETLLHHPEFFESTPWIILRRDDQTMDNRTP